MHRDVAETALPAIIDLRHAGDVHSLAADRPELQGAPPFGDQRLPAAGQEGHRPGFAELRDLPHLERPGAIVRGLRGIFLSGVAGVGGRSAAEEGEGGKKDGTDGAHFSFPDLAERHAPERARMSS
jgi:hypothetical protein